MKMKDCPTSVRHRIQDDPDIDETRPKRESAGEKILAALNFGPRTSAEIIKATGLSSRTVYVETLNMRQAGELVATKTRVPGKAKKINLWSKP